MNALPCKRSCLFTKTIELSLLMVHFRSWDIQSLHNYILHLNVKLKYIILKIFWISTFFSLQTQISPCLYFFETLALWNALFIPIPPYSCYWPFALVPAILKCMAATKLKANSFHEILKCKHLKCLCFFNVLVWIKYEFMMFASHCTLFYLHVTQHNNLFGCTKCFYFNPFQSIENLKLVRATLTKKFRS